MKDSLGWLPSGWIMEIKTRKGGAKAGNLYKCYIAPKTGSKFYSKQEVFRYLKTGKIDHEASQPKKKTIVSAENVVSRIEKSPDGLPPGWTKEIKFRRKIMGHGFRRDPYYTDPVSGCIFRSKRDVIRYLESGNIGMHVSKPKKVCISTKDSTDNKHSSPVTAKRQKLTSNSTRRCLFGICSLNVDGASAEQINGSKLEEQGPEDVGSSSLSCTRKHLKTRKRERVQVKKPSFMKEDKLSESRDKMLVNGVKVELEGKNEAFETDKQLTQNASLSELVVKQQENGALFKERNKELCCNGVPLESEVSNRTGSEVLLGPPDGKQFDNWVLIESEDTKQQIEVQTSEIHKNLVQNMGLSELKDMKQEDGVHLDSRNNKLCGNGLPPESGENDQTEHGAPSVLQDGKQSENLVPITKPLENGAQMETEAKKEEKCKSGRERLQSRKTKAGNATLLPRRASKRLAGLEAEAAALDVTSPKRPHGEATLHLAADHAVEPTPTPSSLAYQVSEQLDQLIFNLQVDPGHAVASTPDSCADQVSKPIDEFKFIPQVDPTKLIDEFKFISEADPTTCTALGTKGTEGLPENPPVEKPQVDNMPESPPILPFGDSWLDPCIEFAFKTLTGDIPVAMDTVAIEDYFQQQLVVGQTQNLPSNDMLQSELQSQQAKDAVGPTEGRKPDNKVKRH